MNTFTRTTLQLTTSAFVACMILIFGPLVWAETIGIEGLDAPAAPLPEDTTQGLRELPDMSFHAHHME